MSLHPTFLYKKIHTVSNSGSTLTDYQIKLYVYNSSGTDSSDTVYLNGKCLSSFNDIRFSNATDPLYYWIESIITVSAGVYKATVWIKYPSLTNGNNTLIIYYGNSYASSESNGTNTFIAFDDFSTNKIGTMWSEVATFNGATAWLTTHTVENNGYHMQPTYSNDSGALAYLKTALTTTTISQVTLEYTGRTGWRSPPWTTFGVGYSSTSYAVFGYFGGVQGGFNPNSPSDTITLIWSDGYTSSNVKGYRSGTLVYTASTTFSTAKSPSFGLRNPGGSNEGVVAYFKNFFVRKYTATEPTHSTWSSEVSNMETGLTLQATPASGAPPLQTTLYIGSPIGISNSILYSGDGKSYAFPSILPQVTYSQIHTYYFPGTYEPFVDYIYDGVRTITKQLISVTAPTVTSNFTYSQSNNTINFTDTSTGLTTCDYIFNNNFTVTQSNIGSSCTFITILPESSLLNSGNRLQFTLKGQLIVLNMAIVERDGSTKNGVTTPTEITFGKGGHGCVISAGATATSDIIDYHIDKDKEYLLLYQMVNGAPLPSIGQTGAQYFTATSESWNQQIAISPSSIYTGSWFILSAIVSNQNEWLWDFNDGSKSNDQHPVHIYTAPGTYNVTLNSSNQYSASSKTTAITVTAPITCDFTITPVDDYVTPCEFILEPLITVNTSLNQRIVSYTWNFGNGETATTETTRIAYIYTEYGIKTITLTVIDNYGTTTTSTKSITIYAQLHANFKNAYNNIITTSPPVNVAFTNLSTPLSQITSHLWNFGDGLTSTSSDPTHSFATYGVYNVSLTVSNANTSDTITYNDCVKIHRSAKVMYENVGVIDSFATIPIKTLTDVNEFPSTPVIRAKIFSDESVYLQHDTPEDPGSDEYGQLSFYQQLDEFGHLIINTITGIGKRIIKIATMNESTPVTLFRTKELNETIIYEDSIEQP